MNTHAARAADPRRVTLCEKSIDDVPLAPWRAWPTCPACKLAVVDNPLHQRALGLLPASRPFPLTPED